MRDHDRRRSAGLDAAQREGERIGIERGQRLVQNDHARSLQERARQEHPALLAVRELPACLADLLEHARGHAVDDARETELSTHVAGEGEFPAWTIWFTVADCDGSVAQVSELGGSVLMPPNDMPFGRGAVVADPAGAVFGLAQVNPDQIDEP